MDRYAAAVGRDLGIERYRGVGFARRTQRFPTGRTTSGGADSRRCDRPAGHRPRPRTHPGPALRGRRGWPVVQAPPSARRARDRDAAPGAPSAAGTPRSPATGMRPTSRPAPTASIHLHRAIPDTSPRPPVSPERKRGTDGLRARTADTGGSPVAAHRDASPPPAPLPMGRDETADSHPSAKRESCRPRSTRRPGRR